MELLALMADEHRSIDATIHALTRSGAAHYRARQRDRLRAVLEAHLSATRKVLQQSLQTAPIAADRDSAKALETQRRYVTMLLEDLDTLYDPGVWKTRLEELRRVVQILFALEEQVVHERGDAFPPVHRRELERAFRDAMEAAARTGP